MNQEAVEKINEEIKCTGYARNRVRSMGNEIADIITRIEFAAGIVSEGILDKELYINFVERQKKEIKDILAEIFNYLHLEGVKGHHDHVFRQDEKEDSCTK